MKNINAVRNIAIVGLMMAGSLPAHAATTVTVDNNEKVIVSQPMATSTSVVTPVIVTPVAVQEAVTAGIFEGRIVNIDGTRSQIIVNDTTGRDQTVLIQPELINNYRIGDYVTIRPTGTTTVITVAENPKDFEGEIIQVNMSKNQMLVLDTTGRERRVQLKQGMIATYKVGDYVRVHLMADLKEAKTIETLSDVTSLEGHIVNVDPNTSRITIRDNKGKDSVLLVRQGQISQYRNDEQVRIYVLTGRDQVQVIRVIR